MDTKITIEKLNENNYFQWKFKMQMFPQIEDLWKVIVADIPTAESSRSSWIRSDETAQAMTVLSVEDSQLVHVRDKNSAIAT